MDRIKGMGLTYLFSGILLLVFAAFFCRRSWIIPVPIGIVLFAAGIVYFIMGKRREKKQNDKD